MKNLSLKALVIGLILLAMPMKQFGQQPLFNHNEATIDFDITEFSIFDQRIVFLYQLINDGRFNVVNSERDGVFLVSADPAYQDMDLQEAFTDFKQQHTLMFNQMDKETLAEASIEYKPLLPDIFVHSLMMDVYIQSRQNNLCANADPFCTDNGLYQFPAGVNAGSGESGPSYDCLHSTPNPAWYYMRIGNPGNIDIYMYSTPGEDIDFCCWGPFEDPVAPCPNGLTAAKVKSCSYSSSATETCHIPSSAQTGEYYILVITNFSNHTCNINFSKTSGSGTTDCGIMPPMVENNGPYCVGETITLTGNAQSGATYTWSGPGNWSATGQTVTRPNCTMNMAGEYTCTIHVGSQSNSAVTTVQVFANPTANFTSESACFGSPIQFTNNSTSNPANQPMTYQWDFGDGQTSNQTHPSHTYAEIGDYTVTLTASCGNGTCTTTTSQSVSVYAIPTANFTADSVCLGSSTQFTNRSTSNPANQPMTYQWDFGDGQTSNQVNPSHTYAEIGDYTVTLTASCGNGTCTSTTSQSVSVYAIPTANFTADSVCLGSSTQFTNRSTSNPANQNMTYLWDFGDGQTSNQVNPSHTYAEIGDYTVTLTASCGNGTCTSTTNQSVSVYAIPTANFTANSVCLGSPAQFTNSSSTNPANQTMTYQWDFGDGQTSNQANPSHTYAEIGDYTVTLTASCGNGTCTSTTNQSVSVYAIPTANFTSESVCLGNSTQFTNSSTTNPANQNMTYLWDFGDGQTSNQANPSHTYVETGDYTVTLTASCGNGTCTSTQSQSVSVFAVPVADAGEDQTVIYNGTAQLRGSAGVSGTFNYHWEPADKVVNPDAQNTQTVSLIESTTFTLTVTHPQGNCSSTDQVSMLVEGSNMTATASASPNSICLGESAQLNAIAVGGTLSYTYSWSPTIGLSNPNIANPMAHPSGNTTYTCRVSDGLTTQDVQVTVTVNHPEYEEEEQWICPGDSYPFYGEAYSEEGDFDYVTTTAQGCEKTITLHLHLYPDYPQQSPAFTTTEYICPGTSFNFHGHDYDTEGTYYENLHTIHGCDSVVCLNLQVYQPNDTIIVDPTICTSQSYNFHGTVYNWDGATAYFDTIDNHGCLQVEKLVLSVGPYQMPPKEMPRVCVPYDETPYYYWDKTGRAYSTNIETDTILPDPEGGCEIKYRLDLKFHQEFYHETAIVECDHYHWPIIPGSNYTDTDHHIVKTYQNTGGTGFDCDSTYVLDLTVNKSIESDFTQLNQCDQYIWQFGWNDESYTLTEQGNYTKTINTHLGCDSTVTMHLQLDYSPNFNGVEGKSWVVGGSEFQYTVERYHIDIDPRSSHSTEWSLYYPDGSTFNKWDLVPYDNGDKCMLYIYTFERDTIELRARSWSTGECDCGEYTMSKWIHCGYYDINETTSSCQAHIFPNPNDGSMTLSLDNMTGHVEVQVYNITGTLIDQFSFYNAFDHQTHDYHSDRLSKGVYFFQFTCKEGRLTKKAIIF